MRTKHESSKRQCVNLKNLSDDSDPSLSDNEHDNNDNAGDKEGKEYSEEALEAGKVLQTTKLLSAHILSKMLDWFSGGDSNGDGNKPNTSAATGLNARNTVDDDQNLMEWILSKEMATIFPKVKLAQYQLIGLN